MTYSALSAYVQDRRPDPTEAKYRNNLTLFTSDVSAWNRSSSQLMALAGGTAGFIFADGNAANVGNGGAITGSGLDNNFCGTGLCVAALIALAAAILETADKVITAVEAYELTQLGLACDAGSQSACNQAKQKAVEFGIETTIELTAGNFVPGSKVGMAIFGALRQKGGKVAEAANDAAKAAIRPLGLPSPQYHVPDGYNITRNANGSASVLGPRGGRYNSTGRYSADGKPVYRNESGGYVTLEGGRVPVAAPTNYTSVPVHHICTNKCNVGTNGNPAWTPRFQKLFDDAGLDINSEINKIAVAGHRGPHPQSYHQYVYGRLTDATRGRTAGTPEYANAVTVRLTKFGRKRLFREAM